MVRDTVTLRIRGRRNQPFEKIFLFSFDSFAIAAIEKYDRKIEEIDRITPPIYGHIIDRINFKPHFSNHRSKRQLAYRFALSRSPIFNFLMKLSKGAFGSIISLCKIFLLLARRKKRKGRKQSKIVTKARAPPPLRRVKKRNGRSQGTPATLFREEKKRGMNGDDTKELIEGDRSKHRSISSSLHPVEIPVRFLF